MGNSRPTLLDFCIFFDPRYKKFDPEIGIVNKIKCSLKELITEI
jgi:hypothetical protein